MAKIKKKLTSLVAITSAISITTVSFLVSISVSAATYSRLIDNDPTSSSGNSSYSSGFSYMSSGSCYNGDARISSSNYSSNFYHWIHPKTTLSPTSVTVDLKVYLNHSNFTDPAASYSVYRNGASLPLQCLNQNTAHSGWNSISTTTGNNFTALWFVAVMPSGKSGYQTGADAVDVRYVY